MPTIELTDDEMNTLHEAFDDVGCDCSSVDSDKFKALGVKLGFWEAEKPPTEEELKRCEEYANSPTGKMMVEMFALSNEYFAQQAAELVKDIAFNDGSEWPIGSQLRIKLPNDYQIKEKK